MDNVISQVKNKTPKTTKEPKAAKNDSAIVSKAKEQGALFVQNTREAVREVLEQTQTDLKIAIAEELEDFAKDAGFLANGLFGSFFGTSGKALQESPSEETIDIPATEVTS